MLKRLNTFINHYDLNVQDFFDWLGILGLFKLKIVKHGMGHSKLWVDRILCYHSPCSILTRGYLHKYIHASLFEYMRCQSLTGRAQHAWCVKISACLACAH